MAESDSQGSGLFSGPHRLQDTAAKYMSPYKETSCKRAKREEDTRDKEARDRTRSDGVSMQTLSAVMSQLSKHIMRTSAQQTRSALRVS